METRGSVREDWALTLDPIRAGWIAHHRKLAWMQAAAVLVLGLIAGYHHEVGSYDSAEADFYGGYAPQAQRLRDGQAFTMTRSGPGYSALLALASFAIPDLFVAGKVLASLGVAAVGLSSYYLARSVAGPLAGLALQTLLYVALFRYSFLPGNDLPCAAFSIVSFQCLLGSGPRRGAWTLAAGVLAAAAAATRYPALAVYVAGAAGLVACGWEGAESMRTRLELLGVYSLGFAAIAGAVASLNLWWHGTPLHSKAHALVALDAYGGPGIKVSQVHLAEMEERFASLGEVVAHDPLRLLGYYPLDFHSDAMQLMADTVTFPLVLFLGWGLVVAARSSTVDRKRLAVLLLYGCLGFAFVALAPYQERYHLAIAPILYLPVAIAVTDIVRTRVGRGVLSLVLAGAIAVLGASSGLRTTRHLTDEPIEILSAAEVLKQHARPGDRLLARKPHLAFLAGVEPDHTLTDPAGGEVVAWIVRGSGAAFLYAGPREVGTNPALRPLAEGADVPKGLELLHSTDEPPTRLYRIVREDG